VTVYRASFILIACLLTACGGSDETPPPTVAASPSLTQTHTPIFDVQVMPTITPGATATVFIAQRATLPPTWTPTLTPTITTTPTITDTPLPTATLTESEICEEDFVVGFSPEEDRIYTFDESIYIMLHSRNRNALIQFRVENQATGTTESFTLPGGAALIDLLSLEFLPEPGIYDWSITLNLPERSGLCEVNGILRVRNDNTLLDFMSGRQNPEVTPVATPEITPQLTEEPE